MIFIKQTLMKILRSDEEIIFNKIKNYFIITTEILGLFSFSHDNLSQTIKKNIYYNVCKFSNLNKWHIENIKLQIDNIVVCII